MRLLAAIVIASATGFVAKATNPPTNLIGVPAPYVPESLEKWPDLEGKKFSASCGHMGERLGKNISAIDPMELGGRGTVCTSSPPPQSAPFGDAEWHVLTERLRYRIGPVRDIVVIPKGFVTDFASIPDIGALRAVFPKDGQYLSAAILHDYLYWDQRCTRDDADNILKNEMLDFGVPLDQAMPIYLAVSAGGGKSWKQNEYARTRSPRIIPETELRAMLANDASADDTWENLRAKLESHGLHATPDAGNYDIAQVCRRAAAESPDEILERRKREIKRAFSQPGGVE